MSKIIIPENYTPALNLYDTQRAIGTVKRLFADTLCATLNLYRVSAPLFLEASTGLNDDLNGVERKVTFDIKDSGTEAQVVQSLAKWKRKALKDYSFRVGKGLYCDMNAIRRDEELDNLHSVYVDQWDWEKVITREERTTEYLKQTVQKIGDAVCGTLDELKWQFPALERVRLCRETAFATAQELEDQWPALTPKERENAFAKAHGTVFIIGIGVAILAAGWPEMLEGRFTHLYVYAFALVFGVIGYIDDYQKVKHHQNTGLTAPQKFILQLAAAVAFLCLMRYEGMLSPNLYIPFFNTHIVMNWVVYMIFAAFVIVGTVNAVNITDGLDGLSSSVTLPVALFFAVMGAVWGGFTQLGVFAGAMFGGLLGFLYYNHYPAKVFMGDTGSMFLGGMVTALAFIMGRPELVFFFGIVYIWDAMTVVIQRVYFKLTHGKRIFRMTPIHHAFEMRGWKEVKIDFFFSLIAIIGVVLGLMYVYMA